MTHKNDRKLPKFLNLHIFFILFIFLFFALIIWKFLHWGNKIDREELNKEIESYTATAETLDMILPLFAHTEDYVDDGINTIAFFGNNPFADDRYSADNLVNIIRQRTGAVVYNFAIEDSFMACAFEEYDPVFCPIDAYSFYWLIELLTTGSNKDFYPAAADRWVELGYRRPEACDDVVKELMSVDFSKVDTVVIMYDAYDYLEGRAMYNDEDYYDRTCFSGALEAGIVKLQQSFPNTRIIVMSPAYAYFMLEDGQYVSSDKFVYKNIPGRDVLSTYSIKEAQSCAAHGVTFIDNLYGTITETNADQYLTDHYHINVQGRKLLADRLIATLQYFDRKEADPQ